ncbi:hypothetical protein N6O32_07220, partial [Escherichia coli]|nr:hypothetical protein [Escherichia coli]MDC7018558.1 hypothetical protein [Escherichia coli]MDC7023241.1 hypothetical protein [Escherichia coli]
MKKHLLTLTLSSILAIPVVSHAEFKGGFADIGVHYLDWTSRTTEKSSTKSHKDDFGYLEFEGGWICPYISRHLLSLNPLQARCRRYSR